MSEDNQSQGSSGTPPDASGNGGKDFVSHDSYVKAVNEAKNAKAKMREMDARLQEYDELMKSQKEAKLLEEKNFTELLSQKNSEIERLSAENQSHIKDKLDFRKMNAAVGLLQQKGINIDPKYMGLLPIDNIVISEETGEVIADSVINVVDSFQKEHPRLVAPIGKLLPNQASGQSQNRLSLNEWKKLGREEKRKALIEKRVDHPGLG